MSVCPRCGGQNPLGNSACETCGMLLLAPPEPNGPLDARAPVAPSPEAIGKKTIRLGIAPNASRKQAEPKVNFAKTMLGLSPGSLSQEHLEKSASKPASGSVEATPTPPDDLIAAPDATNQHTMQGLSPFEAVPNATAAKNQLTMLGLAPFEAIADTINRAEQTLLGSGGPSNVDPTPFILKDEKKGTLLGVAVPGIAPINPGVAKGTSGENHTDSERELETEPNSSDQLNQRLQSAGGTRALVVALATVTAVLVLVSAGAIWWWRTSPKLVVQVLSDEFGHDSLVIECANCRDGSVLTCNGTSAQVRNQRASVPLSMPLKIGHNTIDVSLQRGSARPEAFRLNVPIEFRVKGDMSGLGEYPEKLRLQIDKTPQAEMLVNQQTLNVDSTGHAQYELDVSKELEGVSAVQTVLEKRISYFVRSAKGVTQGTVLLRSGITPLVVDAPGNVFVTEGTDFEVCGRTTNTALVQTSGLRAALDSNGQFCQTLAIREIGKFEIWVRAQVPGQAPRRVRRSIERTPNLRAYAKALYPKVPHDVAHAQSKQPTDSSEVYAISGAVVEHNEHPHSIKYLIRQNDGARVTGFIGVTSFARGPITSGRKITVFGTESGSTIGPDGQPMPEFLAAFVVPGT